MVIKKDVLKELQKFNDDLNEHLPELDLDFLQNKEIFSNKENINELVPLLANNLMDLKTEIALIRKNLVDSVEGMVLRVISQQQKSFSNQMDRMFTQMLVQMKGNFSSYITEISKDIGSVKKDLNRLEIKTDTLVSRFDIFDSKIIELTSSTEEIRNLRKNVSAIVNKEVNLLKSDILKIDSNLMNNIDKKFFEISNMHNHLEESIQESKLYLNNEVNLETNDDMESFDELNNIEDIEELKQPNELDELTIATPSHNLQKLISIEDKLKKLDSLR